MIVFKNYLKIVKQFIPVILMYTIIFTVFAVLASGNTDTDIFISKKSNIAIINNDKSKVTDAFIEYVKTNANVIEKSEVDEKVTDALFYRELDYVLTIPEGFAESILNGKENQIETLQVPDSYNSFHSEMLFNRFWNIAKTYASANIPKEDIANVILKDLSEETVVKTISSNQSELQKVNFFFNFTNYTVLATGVFIIGILMNVFNNINVKKKNIVSPLSYKKLNIQLFLGNLAIMLLLWVLYIVIAIVLYKEVMLSITGLLLSLNYFAFCITVLAIGFLIGNLVKNKEAQNGIVNIIALGSSFICGAFVPQSMLGTFVLSIGKLLPSYWFIKNNNDISALSTFNFETLKPIIINMFIILVFAVIFFIITNLVSKSKLRKS